MPTHLTRITPVDALPDPTLYSEGYPILFEGDLYTAQDVAGTLEWVATVGDMVTAASLELVTVTASAAYTIDGTDRQTVVLGDATTAAFDVTLPAASVGRIVIVKKVDDSANAVTVATPGAETIDGAASHALAAQYDAVRLVCDGTNWFVI